MLKLTVDDECVHQEVHGTAIDIAIDAVRAIAAIYRSLERRDALTASVFRGSVTALIGSSSPVWDTADRLVAYRSKLTRMCDRERFPIEMWRQVAAALDKLEGGNENADN